MGIYKKIKMHSLLMSKMPSWKENINKRRKGSNTKEKKEKINKI